MAIDLNRYAEAYKRGLLNEDQNARLEELERRGLVTLQRPEQAQQQEPEQEKFTQRQQELIPEIKGVQREAFDPVPTKKTAELALKAAPYTLGMVPVPGVGPAVTAMSEAGLGLLEGETLGRSLKRGAVAGGVEAAGGKLLKIGKPILKGLAKFATKGDKNIIDTAIKNPKLTQIPAKTNQETAEQVQDFINILSDKKNKEYEKAINLLPKKETSKLINTKNVALEIQKEGLESDAILNLISDVRPKTIKFNEEPLIKFVNGETITFDEAKKINSLMSSIQRQKDLDPIDRRSIQLLRDQLFKSLDVVKGFKEINKRYADQSSLINNIQKNLSTKIDGQKIIEESKINTLTNDIVKNIQQKRTTKSKLLKNLESLDKQVGKKAKGSVVDQLKANAVQDQITKAIEKQSSPFLSGLTTTGGAAATLYNPVIGGTILGAQLGKGLLRTEPVARRVLKAAQETPSFLRTGAKITSKAAGQLAGRIATRTQEGSYTTESQDQIKRERGVQ
jgi:hypothetical protein